MQVILHLVCLGADIAILQPVHRAKKRLWISDAEIAKLRLHLLIEPASKGRAAPQLVFINARLRFMHPHRYALPQGG